MSMAMDADGRRWTDNCKQGNKAANTATLFTKVVLPFAMTYFAVIAKIGHIL
jgi:hypothetical protein